MNRDDAARAGTEEIDWSAGEVEATPRKATMVYSTRLPDDLSQWLEAEATRRNINPSAMLRELVAEANRASSEDKTVTVRLSELHRAIEQVAGRDAA
jgi:hypothetical protein